MRTLLLVLLIALGAFAFVLRTVEYMVVREQLLEIGDTYHTVGFIQHPDGGHGNISRVVDELWDSGFLATEDRRLVFEATMQNHNNADMVGMLQGLPDENQARLSDAYFYGTVVEIFEPTQPTEMRWVSVRVGDIYVSYEEHVRAGQLAWIGFNPNIYGWETFEPLLYGVGDSFFFRARYHMVFTMDGASVTPQIGNSGNLLHLMPLDGESGLWFLPVDGISYGNADFTMPELAHLPSHFEFLRHHYRALQVFGTRDLTVMPEFSGTSPNVRPVAGRPVDFNDYIEQNHVAYIDVRFARIRGIGVGDTLEVAFHRHQFVDGRIAGVDSPIVRSLPCDDPFIMELEVIGTFSYFHGPFGNFTSTFIYVPASIIPEGLYLSPPIRDIGFAYQPNYIASSWHSFTINDPTREQEFLLWAWENNVLSDYNLVIIGDGSDALNFWAAADPVLLTILFNAIVFWAVVLLVLSLVSFIFVRQRQRDFAIYRGIGMGKATVLWHTVKTLLFFGVPAAVAGAFGGWHVASLTAATALEPFASFLMEEVFLHPILRPPPPQVIEFDLGVGIYWLVIMIVVVLLVLLVMVTAIALRVLNAPVLVLLQGGSVKSARQSRKGNKKTSPVVNDAPITTAFKEFTIPDTPAPTSAGQKLPAALGWIGRHMRRSLAKSLLGLMVALFFIISLGWLQEAIIRNETQIDIINETTVVSGRIGTNLPGAETSPSVTNLFSPGFMGDIIHPNTIAWVHWINNEFFENYGEVLFSELYLESAFLRSFFVSNPDGGDMPEDWQEISGFDISLGIGANARNFNRLRAFNNIDFFIGENTTHQGALEIEFIEGFSKEDFNNFQVGDRIPVIASQQAMEAPRGLELGDYISIGYFVLTVSTLNDVQAQVIGTHNGHVLRDYIVDTSFIPLAALEDMLGNMMGYSMVAFDINTVHNSNIEYVREGLAGIAGQRGISGSILVNVFLQLFLLDEGLRNVTAAVGQTILLLELMYPIALVIAGAIALGLSMLLMLQAAKNAAIMRILGGGKARSRSMLATELLTVCIAGLILGAIWLLLAGWGFGIVDILTISAVYFGGALLGATIGAIAITKKSPLELLQVKE